MHTFKKRPVLLSILALAVIFIAFITINTWRQPSRQRNIPAAGPLALDVGPSVARLSGALRLRTISEQGKVDANGPAFDALHAYLQQQYPLFHRRLSREVVNGYSLLYRWQGTDPDERPILFVAHQDVVPIAPGSEKDWSVAPFSGAVRDGYIWGRGAWDNKGNLLALMEAVELLAARGFQPRQTVYFAFGHDEENGGERGARAIAALLQKRGIRLQFVVDEGFFISDGLFPGLKKPLALIGTAEKSRVTLKLTATAVPGHSSAPASNGAIARLARALVRLDDAPLPSSITGVTSEMLDVIAPEMPATARVVLSNRWLFGPIVTALLKETPSTAAMLRTTTALTVVSAGNKENVLPSEANALVNFRTMPGDSAQTVLNYAVATVDDDAVRISIHGDAHQRASITPTDAPGYRLLEKTIRQTYPGTLVAPGLLIGGTDSKHLAPLADEIYRFTPVHAGREDLARFHGTNERISISDYAEMIRFYTQLMLNASDPPL